MKNKLIELRKQHAYTQEDLAKLTNVSRQTIISIERGTFNPSLILAFKFSKIFNKKIEEMFIYEGNEKDV